ncbi:zinc finger CCCH-type with G patch domain-containing protein isoform X1 [Indicator indicator]|uniref:zinc finger CCCH-type with G patch domain-containing protein isoform X1 n=1 Tax=Indicator indicator TaxID=1002788 RepID=UPI0023DFBA9D|nr:zinc finger CCCH-type with G patch domain-containing protein isoform X1 [Indicator indicator]
MDEENLEAAIQTYNAQLQQVELALGAGQDPSQQSDLIQLQEDLKQLIELTESSLVSVKKSKLLATLDPNAASSSSLVGLEQNTNPDSSAQDEEYAAFKEAIAELGGDEKHSANNDEIASKRETDNKNESKHNEEEKESDREEEEEEEEEELSGMKVKAPYYSSWGTLEYHNAMIVGTEELEDGSAGVRVLYLYPTHKSLKPCPFFLDDKCRFKENCRFSHGQVVSVEELQPFQEPNLSTLEVGSACLAKHSDGIWYTAKITDVDSGYYTVKFDSLLLKEAVVEADSIIPPLRSEDGTRPGDSDAEDSDDDSVIDSGVPENGEWTPACSSSFGGWEAHTRGIGSKLLVQMGYEFGKGLGKNSDGRVEPVQAVVLPRGKSLDQCAEVLQQRRRGQCPGQGGSSGRWPRGSRKAPRDVFDFLNEKLRGKSSGDRAAGMALPKRSSKEIYHASKSSRKALSVHLFQTMEKIDQTQRDIIGIQQALERNLGRHSVATAQLKEKLANAHRQLGQLQAQEARLQREQKTADTHKKMAEF